MWHWRFLVFAGLVLTGFAYKSGYELIAYFSLAVMLVATV